MRAHLLGFGWLLVQASLVAIAVNLGKTQGEEWGAFFGILAFGWAGFGFWHFLDDERRWQRKR